MMRTVSYDDKNDILFVHLGFDEGEEFATNLCEGNVILDISSKGSIRGVELMNASECLARFGITTKFLLSITDADFTASKNTTGTTIELSLCSKSDRKNAPLHIAIGEP